MKPTILLISLSAFALSTFAQTNNIEIKKIETDTLTALTKNGIVIRLSHQITIDYNLNEHQSVSKLYRFCVSETRHAIRQEVLLTEPASIDINNLTNSVTPRLDSIFHANKIYLKGLLIKKL